MHQNLIWNENSSCATLSGMIRPLPRRPAAHIPPLFLNTLCIVLLLGLAPLPSQAQDFGNPDTLPSGDTTPEFSTGNDATSPESINPLARPNQILFNADIGFIPTVGPNVSGTIGNSQPGVGFLVGLEVGYTILPNLVLTAGMSIHAFGNLTNLPLFIGTQYYFDNGGGLPMTVGGQNITLIPYIDLAFGPAFNLSTDSNKVGVGALAFAFRIGPGVLLPFGKNKRQGIFFEIDYETQSGPFNGDGITSSAFALIPVKIGYTTIF